MLRTIRHEHAIVPVLEEWRELTKLLNTYLGPLPTLIDERDGRLHTTFNQAVAATGRLSTSNPNLQSIPIRTDLGREIRSAFVAEDGHRLLSADYSQVELRILAHVSGEPVLREAFERGEDIHAATAAEVLGKERAELTRSERDVAKMVNFGIIYGISAFGLSENLEIPREEAQAYIDTYLARFPRVQELIERTVAQAAADGYVTTLLGRRRPIPELRASNWQTRSLGERLAVNTVMQGTAADVIKVAMVRIHDRLRAEGRSARLVLQVHDELLLEVPRDGDLRRPRARARGDGGRLPARPTARRGRRRGRQLGRSEGLRAGEHRLAPAALRPRRPILSHVDGAATTLRASWPRTCIAPGRRGSIRAARRIACWATPRRQTAGCQASDFSSEHRCRRPAFPCTFPPSSGLPALVPSYTPPSTWQTTPSKSPHEVEEGVWTTGPDGELVPDYDSTFPTINEGEVVHGTVVRVDKDEVLVDIGYKSEGVIPVAELSIRRNVNPADEVSVGEEIDALVMTKEDAEGRLILSKKRARFELAWKAIEAAETSGEPVNGRVIEVVKGGLILDLGVRGFLPASLVDIRRVQDLDEFLGKELRCKVIELNRSRNNVVLSRRAVLEDERKEMRQAILDRLNPGDVVEGTISNIVDFGAFVDLDGMDGLIHISELSWSHVNHPSEVLEIGQTVQVKVLDIDRDRQRISLGPQADADRSVAAGARPLRRGRRRRGTGHEGGHLRRLRRDPAGCRGPRAHLRARRAPRGEPA